MTEVEAERVEAPRVPDDALPVASPSTPEEHLIDAVVAWLSHQRHGQEEEAPLTHSALSAAVDAGRALGLSAPRALVRAGLCDPVALKSVLTAEVHSVLVDPMQVPSDALAALPLNIAQQYWVAPSRVEDGTLTILYALEANPSSAERRRTEQESAVDSHTWVPTRRETIGAIHARMAMPDSQAASDDDDKTGSDIYNLLLGASDPASTRLREVFSFAFAQAASDIHLDPVQSADGGLNVVARVRVLGELVEVARWDQTMGQEIMNRVKVHSQMQVSRVTPADAKLGMMVPKLGRYTLRVGMVPLDVGSTVVLRLQPHAATASQTVADLFPPHDGYDVIAPLLSEAMSHTAGLVLLGAPTGNGKSTTLAAMLVELSAPERKIITIEDPVEFLIPGAQQAAATTQMDFNAALKAFLRLDPDILMVGEIRDSETVDTALRAAQTGHLLLSTVHARDAALVLRRMIDEGAERSVLAEELRMVLSQRLVKQLCVACSRGGLRNTDGCDSCSEGWSGRLAIAEALVNTTQVAEAIAEGERASRLRELDGYHSFADHAAAVLRAGATTTDEIARVFGKAFLEELTERDKRRAAA